MPDKELLEAYPLYRKKQLTLPYNRENWPKPAITAECPVCKSSQTFNMINDYSQFDENISRVVAASQGATPSQTLRLVYGCAGCQRFRRYFMVSVIHARPAANAIRPPATEGAATVFKTGQYPAYEIRPDTELAMKLGPRSPIFVKGLICESQGFGIGAFAYYRRIVEDVIDELLDEILPLIPEDDRAKYAEALAHTKASHNATDKIDLVKHLLPPTLRPGGANPLALLHGTLSEGIHALEDEVCLTLAISTREVLVYLVHQINETRISADRFGQHLKRLLDERSSRGAADQ